MHLPEGAFLQTGKYKIVRFIKSGGFGCTYEGEQTLMGARVAIKEFFVSDFCNRAENQHSVSVGTKAKEGDFDKFKKSFIKEATVLYKMQHPNIVRVTDVFNENGTAYYVMDYIEGSSLLEIVDTKGPLNEEEAVGYIKQISEALKYVHAQHRMHLDVKPGNVMVDNNGEAILIDFGASKYYDEQTGEQTSTLLGVYTNGYAPPEQRNRSFKTFKPATDIYALGATLYKLLTGVTPPDSLSLLLRTEQLAPLPSSISASTRKAVAAAMALFSDQRPQTIDEFLKILSTPVIEDDNQGGISSGKENISGEKDSELSSKGISKGTKDNSKPDKDSILESEKDSKGGIDGASKSESESISESGSQSYSLPESKSESNTTSKSKSISESKLISELDSGSDSVSKPNQKPNSVSKSVPKAETISSVVRESQHSADDITEVEVLLDSVEKPQDKLKEKPINNSGNNTEVEYIQDSIEKPQDELKKKPIPNSDDNSEVEVLQDSVEKSNEGLREEQKQESNPVSSLAYDKKSDETELSASSEAQLVNPTPSAKPQFTPVSEQDSSSGKSNSSKKKIIIGVAAVLIVGLICLFAINGSETEELKGVPEEEPLTEEYEYVCPVDDDNEGYINGYEFVDLGLPSGLKWATYNIGASSPEEYGDYFAWGETKTKESYDEKNSETFGKNKTWLVENGYINSDGNLTMAHDAARQLWGSPWRMPTKEELDELVNFTTSQWVTRNGVNGRLVTSVVNDKSIFLPAAGLLYDVRADKGGQARYWSSTIDANTTKNAYNLYLYDEGLHPLSNDRSRGRTIRPVAK